MVHVKYIFNVIKEKSGGKSEIKTGKKKTLNISLWIKSQFSSDIFFCTSHFMKFTYSMKRWPPKVLIFMTALALFAKTNKCCVCFFIHHCTWEYVHGVKQHHNKEYLVLQIIFHLHSLPNFPTSTACLLDYVQLLCNNTLI